MSYLPHVADETDLPTLRQIKQTVGFVPKFFLAQTIRPDLIDAEAQLVGAILVKQGALARRQKEYIFLVCSAANLSTYCVTAHCEIVRMLGLEGPDPEQIAIDHAHTKIAVADKALLNFCAKFNKQPSKIGADDIEVLRTYGFGEQHVLEAIVTVGFAQFANTFAFGLGTVTDFHNRRIQQEVGRAPAVSLGGQ